MKPTYIKFHIVKNKPGNPIVEIRVRLDVIMSFSACDEEFCKLGGATQIDYSNGIMVIATESYEEVSKLVEEACLKQVS